MTKTFYADRTGCIISEGDFDAALFANPLLDPKRVLFHHEFNYYGVAAADMAVTVNHPALAGYTNVVDEGLTLLGLAATHTTVLLDHNLGYVPKFFVSLNGSMLAQGIPVQNQGGGRVRFVTAYATTTQIILWERYYSTATTLDAISLTYAVAVFRSSVADPALPMLEINPGTLITFGQGKFRVDQAHLRISDTGDTPFDLALGPTAAIGGGALRVVPPGGAASDYGPYPGSFAGSAYLGLTI